MPLSWLKFLNSVQSDWVCSTRRSGVNYKLRFKIYGPGHAISVFLTLTKAQVNLPICPESLLCLHTQNTKVDKVPD